jgi:hypothetical protein
VAIQLYNNATASWDQFDLMGNLAAKRWYSEPVYDGQNYINSGAVSMRFLHIGNGFNTHDLILDYVVLKNALGIGGGVTDHGALTGLAQDDHTQYLLPTELNATSPVSYDPTNGTISLGTVGIANGGTGQTTAQAAIDALLPSQTGNNGKVLGTNGTTASWVAGGGGSGDMTKATYDADDDGEVTNAEGIYQTAASGDLEIITERPNADIVLNQDYGTYRDGLFRIYNYTGSASPYISFRYDNPVNAEIGINDTLRAELNIYGNNSVDGGAINIYNGASADSPTDSWSVKPIDANRLGIFASNDSTAILAVHQDDHIQTDQLLLNPISSPTATAAEGMIYYDTDDNKVKFYDGSSWADVGGAGGSGGPWYGDGSDGDVVLDGTNTFSWASKAGTPAIYTLNRPVYIDDLTVSGGAVINPNGYHVYIAGTLTGALKLYSNGGNGGAGGLYNSPGAGGTAAHGAGSLPAVLAGKAGSGTGVGFNGSAQTSCDTNAALPGASGGDGGLAEGFVTRLDGGSGGTVTKLSFSDRSIMSLLTMRIQIGPTLGQWNLHGGGGSGAMGRGSIYGAGGGSGGNGGNSVLCVRDILSGSSVDQQCKGGAGGSGGGIAGNEADDGGGGGGAGGSGGVAVCLYGRSAGTITQSAAGGTGGGGGTGLTSNGLPGGNGPDGLAILINAR